MKQQIRSLHNPILGRTFLKIRSFNVGLYGFNFAIFKNKKPVAWKEKHGNENKESEQRNDGQKNDAKKCRKDQKGANKEPVKVTLAVMMIRTTNCFFKEAIKHGDINADVTVANDGKELMDKLKDTNQPNPDIIFLDINMPRKDGKECLKEIKKDENLKDIPTVMFTTSDNEKDIDDAFKAGANLYVQKPGSFRGFVNLLKKIFSMD